MSTFIPLTPAATKSAEQHEEPSEQDSFNHLLYQVLRFTSEQVQDLNHWMIHQGIPNVHEIIVQGFRRPQILEDDLHFIRENKTCYIKTHVMVSLSLMIAYIKHLRCSDKAMHFGPFYYIQIDPQDYDEWRIKTPEEEIHFQTPSKLGSPATPRSMATSQTSESYITLTYFKKGVKRDASAYPILKNERYYNTFIRHFKATAKAQGLNTLMDPNFTPGSDEYEQQLFQEQQDFLYSVLISSLKTDFSEALVKDHEGDAQLILELLHEHHTGNSQYSRSEINRITMYLTNIKLDDTWRGTNESFLMHYNDQLRLLDSLVDSDEKRPDNTRVTFLESAVESVPDLRRVKITDNVLQAQLDSTRPISYRSYFDLLRDAAFHLDQATKRGNKIRRTNVHFSGPNDEDEHQNLSSDDPQVIQQENVSSEPPEPFARIPSTTPGAEPPRDARDSGSARSHSTHLETSSSDRPKWSPTRSSTRYQDQISVTCTRRTLRMPSFTRAAHAEPSLSNFPRRDSNFGERTCSRGTTLGERKFPTFPQNKKTKLTHCSIYVPMRTIATSHAK